MKEHGICAKCKKSVGCPYADDRIKGCKKFVLEPELKLTNKEWIRQCDTEQLATFLAIVQYDGTDLTLKKNHVEKWVDWLKEKHE